MLFSPLRDRRVELASFVENLLSRFFCELPKRGSGVSIWSAKNALIVSVLVTAKLASIRQEVGPTIECDPAFGEFVDEVYRDIGAFGQSEAEKGYLLAEFGRRVHERFISEFHGALGAADRTIAFAICPTVEQILRA